MNLLQATALVVALYALSACDMGVRKGEQKVEEDRDNDVVSVAFASQWQVTADGEIRLPLPEGYRYSFSVDWGDGSQAGHVGRHDDADASHVYQRAGLYTVKIRGLIEAWSFWRIPHSKDKLIRISDLGDAGWRSFFGAFALCDNLTAVQGGGLASVEDMGSMFDGAALVEVETHAWDTSKVQDMSYMFTGASSANPQVDFWDTRNVSDMSYIFANTQVADPDVNMWDVRNVRNMAGMFYYARAADPDTSRWVTASATDMSSMFMHASVASPNTDCWNTAGVTNMQDMFNGAAQAMPDVSCWDVSAVVNMDSMFSDALVAVPDMSAWDFASVRSMEEMLRNIALPPTIYSSMLQRLALTAHRNDVVLDAGNSYYHEDAVAAREALLAKGWEISDAGLALESSNLLSVFP